MRATFVIAMALGCGRIGYDIDSAALPPCVTNVCECNSDDDCGAPHTYCSAHAGSHTCECVAGYAGQSGACVWAGVVADPAIDDATAWSTTPGAAIDAARLEAGMLDGGAAHLTNLDRLSQSIVMPRLSRAEPLVMQISTQGFHDTDTGQQDQPTFGLARAWYDVAGGKAWGVVRTCLGADAYAPETSHGAGVAMPLQIMPASAAVFVDVDHVEIVPANPGECVAPGAIAAGDAETDGAWKFFSTWINTPDATSAGFADGVGANGSRGARLYVVRQCDHARFTLPIAVPAATTMPSPALTYWVNASAGAQLEFAGQVAGTGTPTTVTSCLPAPARGHALDLLADMWPGGDCAVAIGWDVVFDDLALVDDPGCGTDPSIADPGFESGHVPSGIDYAPYASPGASTVAIATGSAQAHSGNAALRMAATVTGDYVQWTTTLYPPASSASGGPGLEFYYRGTVPTHFVLTVQRNGNGQITFPQAAAWQRGVACFDPILADRPQPVIFALGLADAGPYGVVAPEESVVIDDLALVNDPSCPQ